MVETILAVLAGFITTDVLTQVGVSLINIAASLISFILIEVIRRRYFKDKSKPK